MSTKVKSVLIACLLSVSVLSMTACNQTKTENVVTSSTTTVSSSEEDKTADTGSNASIEDVTENENGSITNDSAVAPEDSEPGVESSVAVEVANATAQYVVAEPSQENIRNAVLELDPAYDTEKLDAFLKAQYDEENSEDVPWTLSKVQCAVKDDTSGNVYIINYTQTGTLLKICNMTDDSIFIANLAPELLSITITSDDTATYLNVAADRGNLIGGYVFDLTNEKVLVDTFARDTEEGVTDEQVYPEEYLKYANLDTIAVIK